MSSKKITLSPDQVLMNISQKLDVITRLLALSLQEKITQNQKILILSEMGLVPKEISIILGTTNNTVSVALDRMKKQIRKRGNKP